MGEDADRLVTVEMRSRGTNRGIVRRIHDAARKEAGGPPIRRARSRGGVRGGDRRGDGGQRGAAGAAYRCAERTSSSGCLSRSVPITALLR
jgi:hypothetical protein